MHAQTYWNEIGSTKVFEDPLYVDKLAPFISPTSLIVEYGCGYGRMLRILKEAGYSQLIGFDFAPNMIKRGQNENPDLDLRLLNKAGEIPFETGSIDVIAMSTVLCCIPEEDELLKVIAEARRVLKNGGVFYLTDFLLSSHPKSIEKYHTGFTQHGTWGVYTTSENLTVRHFTSKAILRLLDGFDMQWYEQFDFKTMNQNPARTFHCIAKK